MKITGVSCQRKRMVLFWPLSLMEPSRSVFHHSKPQCMILKGQTVGVLVVKSQGLGSNPRHDTSVIELDPLL